MTLKISEHVARCYENSCNYNELEIQWVTGQLLPNQEAFISYKLTNFSNQGTFYTDSNGLYAGYIFQDSVDIFHFK